MSEQVETLEQEETFQNTDTEQEEIESTETEETDNSTNDEIDDNTQETKEEESKPKLSEADMDSLSDDEFYDFFETGIIPDRIKNKVNEKTTTTSNKSEKQTDTETITNTSTKDTKEVPKTKKKEVEDEVDYKQIYDTLFKPFKANGKDIQPRTVDDIVSLMQQGANYTKKMQAIAPYKKIVESLNKAKISTEDDINFLIDIHNGDSEAIKKLLGKYNVNPIDLDMESINYIPKNNMVSKNELDFKNTIDGMDQQSLTKIEHIIMKEWDEESKNIVLTNNDALKGLYEEIAVLGRFDEINAEVEREKMLGRYENVPYFTAYVDIARKKSLEADPNKKDNPITKVITKSKVMENKTNQSTDKQIADKKKAAPTKDSSGSVKTKLNPNDLLKMSDEDFKKLDISDLI